MDYLRPMIPRLDLGDQLPAAYQSFLVRLREGGFEGEIRTDYASRLVCATDNSVYQLVPQAVVFPAHEADVSRVLKLSTEAEFFGVKLSPRGGGTGTNGQSLCDGIIMDLSRHFRSILEKRIEEGYVRVQPGVVLDQLNLELKPSGVFFAPNLSPSNRATIGGMINTDASGKGSRIYGKTSEHVLSLRAVLMDGSVIITEPLSPKSLEEKLALPGLEGDIYREVQAVLRRSGDRVRTELPRLKRFLTGYDLAHVVDEMGRFDLSRVLAGAEGTLAVITEAKLRLTPIPKHKKLVAIRYSDFDAALRAAQLLVQTGPGAIETIDSTIVRLAKGDVIWHSVEHLVTPPAGRVEEPLSAINLVEFESDVPEIVDEKTKALVSLLEQEQGQAGKASGFTVAEAASDIAALWTLRKKGVGLLGNAKGERRPVPFVEDTAVPPEHLADYIKEFRALLDQHGLRYGMFGHVDVGCLHVRPALNLRSPEDEKLYRRISDDVVRLVKKYGGVLWGEHGRGYRSEYTPTFFGPELYAEMRKIKGVFDPRNQLNPGKLATPPGSRDKLVSVDSLKRGELDRQIPEAVRSKYEPSINCNGNGACFDFNPDSVMCPSSKVTQDRIHSPKGRAGILREWLRLITQKGHDAGAQVSEELPELLHGRNSAPADFSHEVYDAMNGCLACKACATQCPIQVDIPNLRADFLQQYHLRYRRPLKDYFVAALETVLRFLSVFPRATNFLMALPVSVWLLRKIGIVDSPRLAEKSLLSGLAERSAEFFDEARFEALSGEEKRRAVVLLPDAFTTFYEPQVFLAAFDLLRKLGRRVFVTPYRENGKALHIKGFLGAFGRRVRENANYYQGIARHGVPLVGVEPAVTLTYRDEYRHVAPETPLQVMLLQEYLGKLGEEGVAFPRVGGDFRMFAHCTERTFAPKSLAQWKAVFARFGAELKEDAVGCCGMCGVFGHEAEHYDESRGVFAMSWEPKLARLQSEERSKVLSTGHSCRSQVKRFGGFLPRHPAEALIERCNELDARQAAE